jgi:hypothetical protein
VVSDMAPASDQCLRYSSQEIAASCMGVAQLSGLWAAMEPHSRRCARARALRPSVGTCCRAGCAAAACSACLLVWPCAMSQSSHRAGSILGAPVEAQPQSTSRAWWPVTRMFAWVPFGVQEVVAGEPGQVCGVAHVAAQAMRHGFGSRGGAGMWEGWIMLVMTAGRSGR